MKNSCPPGKGQAVRMSILNYKPEKIMRTIRLLLIFFFTFNLSQRLFAQINDLNTARERINALISAQQNLDQKIQTEMDSALNVETNTQPKGEFETTTEYDERLKQNELKRQEIEQRFADIKTDRQASLERELELLLSKAYPAPVTIELGQYRPDLQRFPFTVPEFNKKGSLLMPIAIAPDFKADFATLKPTGYFQFSRTGEQRLIYVRVDFQEQSFTARTDRRMEAVNNLATLTGHNRPVNAVIFSSDGALLASGSDDRTVKIWDVKKNSLLYNLTGHTKYVTCLAFHPFEQVLASGADDGAIIIWRIEGAKQILNIPADPEGVKRLAFSPDGKQIAAALSDFSIKIGRFPMANLYRP
jgi:WD40 repeat protein